MPPRSRKAAAAKKPSPRGKKSTSRTLPAIGTDVPDATEVISADDVKLEPLVTEEDSPVADALAGEDKERKVDATETEKVEEGTAAENIERQEASGEGEGKEDDAKENKMEIEGKENVAEEDKMEIVGKEHDAEENNMQVDGNETSAAENKMETEEGDKQLVEGETGIGEVEHICGSVADNDGNVESIVGMSDNNATRDGKADDEENEEGDDEADDGENEVDDEGENDEVDDEDNEDEEDEEDDPALYMQAPLSERKRQKHFEIFVGGLDKGAVEEDVIKVFGTLGEIQSVRIAKHPVTQKSKGFAFVRYASMDHARKALTEFKDGTEVKGKHIRISASDDNDTIFLGNICKTWTKDNVIEALKGYGIEQIEDILLPEHPKHEGRIRGFAFLEFSSHTYAMAAFQRLRKPDAVFGRDISAKVSFAQTPLHPSEESLLQVKTVHLEGIPRSWDEGKVGELCKQHGEIEKIQLSRNFASTKKDSGFVEFGSRDAAIACVEGINNAELREGDINVRANLAKPSYKSRLARRSARGGYKTNMDGEAAKEVSQPKKKKKAKSKVTHDNGETQPKLTGSNGSKPPKPQHDYSIGGKGKSSQSSKDKKRGRQGMNTGTGGQASKKARIYQKDGRVHGNGRPPTGFGNQRNPYFSSAYVTQQTSYAPSYATPAGSYAAHAYGGTSGSYRRRSDLAPHAGFVPAAQQVRNPYDYQLQRPDAYDSQLRRNSGYAGASLYGAPYPEYSSYAGYQAGHTYPSRGAYGYRGPY